MISSSLFQTLARHRELLWALVKRDWQAKYRGSLLGSIWSLVVPFCLVGIYTVFFAGILQVQARPGGNPTDFALFLMCGSIPWWSFNETLTRSTTSLVEQRNLIKKVVFPLDLVPATLAISGAISEVIGLVVLAIAIFVLQGAPGPGVLLVPLLVVLRVVFTTGISWLLASLGVFFRDLTQVVAVLLTAWMFLTPIFYDPARVPAKFSWLIFANPMTWLVTAYRSVLLDNRPPAAGSIIGFACVAVASALAGHYWFSRTSPAFADVV